MMTGIIIIGAIVSGIVSTAVVLSSVMMASKTSGKEDLDREAYALGKAFSSIKSI